MASTRTLRLLLGAAALAFLAVTIKAASDIIGPLMLALALTIVFHPLRKRLTRRVPAWLASVSVVVGVYLLLIVLGLMLLVSIARMAQLLPQYQAQLNEQFAFIGTTLNSWGISQSQLATMKDSVDTARVASAAASVLGELLGVLSNFFFIVVLLLFLAFDGAHTEKLMTHARRFRPNAVEAMSSFARGTRAYLSVSAIFGLIVAVVDTGALWIMGVPGAFVWGVLAFVTNFVPNIGFVIGVVPPALIALLDGGPTLMLAVIIVYSVINFVIQSIIQPRVIGNSVGLSTTLTFLSLVFWTFILGPLGAILAVPMSLLLRAVIVEADPTSRWVLPLVSGRLDPPEPDAPAPG
ncbi:AI-2E family transporter [Janibacter alittae]|uniref:AI-2E family transporter n=1 Tax=Janibacter alittae TaxID=3115209 RepID=A0ABZ2MEH0_9MICO